MIFYEHNMNIRDTYTIADTENWNGGESRKKYNLLVRAIQDIVNNNLYDDKSIQLYYTEIYHINSISFISDKDDNSVIVLDTEDDFNKHVSIMDKGNGYRIICFNNLTFIGDKHFNVLSHKETCFNKELQVFTIFVDQKFGTGNKEEKNDELIDLIGTCVDTIITENTHIKANYFYNYPIMDVDVSQTISGKYFSDILTPIQIVRLPYTAQDIRFIIDIMDSIIEILKHDFNFLKEDIVKFYEGKGIFSGAFGANIDIINILYDEDNVMRYLEAANKLREVYFYI